MRECESLYAGVAPVLSAFFPFIADGVHALDPRTSSHGEVETNVSEEVDDGEVDQEETNVIMTSDITDLASGGVLHFFTHGHGLLVSLVPPLMAAASATEDDIVHALVATLVPTDGGGGEDAEAAFDALVSELLGNVAVGIADVDAVSTLREAREFDPEDVCVICRDKLSDSGDSGPVRQLTKCRHAFCAGCIEQWLTSSKKCPMCMTWLDETT